MTPFQTKHNKTSALDKARVSVALILIMALSMSIRVVAFASRSGRPTLCSSSAISQYRPRRQQQRRQCLSMSTEAMTTLEPGSHDSEMEVKKSRFIGYAKNVETWKDAQEYLEEVKSLHPKCRHACFGFVAGVNPVQERCSDDGEPTGTAGVPILGAIKGEGISDTVCIVIRYFGGIKLGAGGLIRAYGGAARQVLREAPKQILIPKCSFRVIIPSSFVGSLYDSVSKANGVTSDEEYGADGSLTATITCELEHQERLRTTLIDATRGEASFPED